MCIVVCYLTGERYQENGASKKGIAHVAHKTAAFLHKYPLNYFLRFYRRIITNILNNKVSIFKTGRRILLIQRRVLWFHIFPLWPVLITKNPFHKLSWLPLNNTSTSCRGGKTPFSPRGHLTVYLGLLFYSYLFTHCYIQLNMYVKNLHTIQMNKCFPTWTGIYYILHWYKLYVLCEFIINQGILIPEYNGRNCDIWHLNRAL